MYCEFLLDRLDQTYEQNEELKGNIQINSKQCLDFQNSEIKFVIQLKGKINSQNELSSNRLNSLKKKLQSKVLMNQYQVLHLNDLKINDENQFPLIPFSIKIKAKKDEELFNTYYGQYFQCVYHLSLLKVYMNDLKQQLHTQQIFITSKTTTQYPQKPLKFNLKLEIDEKQVKKDQQNKFIQDALIIGIEFDSKNNDKRQSEIRKKKLNDSLDIEVMIQSNVVDIMGVVQGNFIIKEFNKPISSVDLLLFRVEQIVLDKDEGGSNYQQNAMKRVEFSESSEIQLFQIAVGDIQKNIEIPFQMIMPKYFSVPNFRCGRFQLDFQINFQIISTDGVKIQRSFPIIIIRKN